MSTLRGRLTEYLTKCGLDPEVADEIINTYRDGPLFPRIERGVFEMDTKKLPRLFELIKLGVRQEAVKWIDENDPGHFARAFFISV